MTVRPAELSMAGASYKLSCSDAMKIDAADPKPACRSTLASKSVT